MEGLREAAEALAPTQSKPSEEFDTQIAHPVREKKIKQSSSTHAEQAKRGIRHSDRKLGTRHERSPPYVAREEARLATTQADDFEKEWWDFFRKVQSWKDHRRVLFF